ncbi:hypothetical protein [Streptomyces gilvus]|uniref:hypothetical protein n=1 Tax=Streptomyces gilvus TaxID=2920937 RepID=UPI001F111C75|nr:hypothetical protein [Streptomyces sp. CME 23]MCH5677817.1 hypothetical protein [Streptomyces sp. CME 23]
MREPQPRQGRDLHLVAQEPTLVTTTADRRLAAEHWLLAGSSDRDRTRAEWRTQGVAMFPLGVRFSAVRLPGALVLAAAGLRWPARADEFLGEVLEGGPVICDPRGDLRYYALVPASVPVTWHQAVEEWRAMDVDCLGRESIMGIPRLGEVEPNRRPPASYWSVPMASPGELCAPLAVARLIAAGRHQLGERTER